MNRTKKTLIIAMLTALTMILITSCSGDSGGEAGDVSAPFAKTEVADLSGYESMADYSGESRLIETDVAEAIKLINDKESFILFFSYEDCPYCNQIMPYVNEVAEETGQFVGYVDTRSDPEWQSNMDIDNYDLVIKYFGDYLQKDEDGKDHLYTPDIYFIKNGKVVARHDGVIPGEDLDPSRPLTSGQEETLKETLKEKFRTVQ